MSLNVRFVFYLYFSDCAVADVVFLSLVQESMEQIDNPLHEAAKRGNINFMNECINNRVSI